MEISELKEWTEYRDGGLYWLKSKKKADKGDRVGCLDGKGYRQFMLNKCFMFEHRAIFLYHHGYLPEFVDHKDRNPFNNKIENLRPCTKGENNRNAKIPKSNTSGVKGVTWNASCRKWQAQIRFNGHHFYLGIFSDIKKAEMCVRDKRNSLHKEFANHGVKA